MKEGENEEWREEGKRKERRKKGDRKVKEGRDIGRKDGAHWKGRRKEWW
jgi:hypothetical protein